MTFDFGPCEHNSVLKIITPDNAAILIPCNSRPQIPDRYQGRILINNTTGSITLHNVTRSDEGYYRRVRTNGNGKNEILPLVEIRVLDSIWIHELFHNHTDGTISLSRCHAENPGVITWTIDGKDLLDQRWLSPDNRTLTIPYNYTGVITVSNLVSADNKSIAVIRDLNGESGNLGLIMYLNMTTVKWGDGGDEPAKGTLILPRNISAIYVLLTPSDETREPQWGSWKGFICVPVLVVLLLVIVGIYVCKKANCQLLYNKGTGLHCSANGWFPPHLEKRSYMVSDTVTYDVSAGDEVTSKGAVRIHNRTDNQAL